MSIYDDIKAERARQDEQWGGAAHDDTHHVSEWWEYRKKFEHRAYYGYGAARRAALVKIAALAALDEPASIRLNVRGLQSLTEHFGRIVHGPRRGGIMLTREMATAILIELQDKLSTVQGRDNACYVLPNGECISPLQCIHGDGVPLDEFAALLAAARQGAEDTANMDWLQSHFVDVVPVRLRTGEWGYVIRPVQEDLPLRDALRAARAAAQPEAVSE